MTLKDTNESYGAVTRALHWFMAIAIFAMFGLGVWMVGLDYYSPYYTSAPDLHRSAGMILLVLLAVRFLWRVFNAKPSLDMLSPFERQAAHLVHWGFYVLLAALSVSGYLISTLDGRAIDVFGWVTVPSLFEYKGGESTAGVAHKYLAYATMAVALLHTIAALKHHLVDRDAMLVRMWFGRSHRSGKK